MSGPRNAEERFALHVMGFLVAAAVLGGLGLTWLFLWARFHR